MDVASSSACTHACCLGEVRSWRPGDSSPCLRLRLVCAVNNDATDVCGFSVLSCIEISQLVGLSVQRSKHFPFCFWPTLGAGRPPQNSAGCRAAIGSRRAYPFDGSRHLSDLSRPSLRKRTRGIHGSRPPLSPLTLAADAHRPRITNKKGR